MKNLKKIIYIASIGLLFNISNMSVEAANKSTSMSVQQDAKNITFTIEFEKGGNYTAKLIGPDEKEYDYVSVDDDTLSCEVQSVKAGTWITNVESENEIGKYVISAQGKKATATTSLDSSVSVGKDIVGLKLYFKDRTLCAEWTDTALGNVVIKVINLDNSEVLFEDSIEKNSCEIEIPDKVINIEVSVVPGTSRNVEGAAKTYTYEIPQKPNLDINFNADSVTKESKTVASVKTDDEYSFYVKDNDIKVYSSEINAPGRYEIPIELDDGENNIQFFLIDKDGNMYSYDKSIVCDTSAPLLSLDKEYDQIKTYDENFEIRGKVADYNVLFINDNEINAATDGVFEYIANLHVGENAITVKAIDQAGNEAKYDLVIIREEQKVFPVKYIFIGLITVIAITVLAFFSSKLKNMSMRKRHNINMAKVAKEEKEIKVDKIKKEPLKIDYRFYILSHKNMIIKYASLILVLVFIFFIAFHFNYISSESMEPTLMTGNIEVANALAYTVRTPQRGDVITFKSTEENGVKGKRVIGIAGDKIEFHDGYVYLNGELLDESNYLEEDMETNCQKAFEVPKGTVFVLGDNRENSIDSRFYENPYIKVSDIRDKYMFSIPLRKIL